MEEFSHQGAERSVVCHMKCHVLMSLLQCLHWYSQTVHMRDHFSEYPTVFKD